MGLSGAICYKDKDHIEIHKMPVVKIQDSAYTRWYDTTKIIDIFNSYSTDTKVYIEYQRPMSQQGVVSVFRLGRGFGLLEGLIRSRFNTIELVDPKTWQNYIYKKYLPKDEILDFKEDLSKVIERVDPKYKEIFEKKANTKSFKLTKLKTLYCFTKSGLVDKFSIKEIEDHDKIDSLMIAIYGESKNSG